MLELAFSESAAGSLKMAKSWQQEKEQCGSSKDVAALTLALDMGNISDVHTDMSARKRFLDELFADFPDVSAGMWETNQHTLRRLQEVKATLEPVRIWICVSNPAELCGLYWVCRLLVDAQTALSVVRIPEHIQKDNSLISYSSAGEIPPDVIIAFTEYEETISELQRKVYANIWNSLVRENAPLRAVINGRLIGVPNDFYDFALRANIPDGEFMIARLIGKTLGQITGVGDRWLFLRIQAMLETGELIEVSAATGDHPYSGVVKRSHATRRGRSFKRDIM